MTKPLYTSTGSSKQTVDVQTSRLNSYPSIIKDSSGRLIIFYEKDWKSGRLSQDLVSVTTGLQISVPAGNGEIDGTPVSWSLATLTVLASSYSLIYVDIDGVVRQTTDIVNSIVASSIILAYVGSGVTEVVYVDNIEKTGTYIFTKRQVLSGSNWVWDDYEYRLNVGKNPTASYDSMLNRVYLSFSKDSCSYVRVFDLTNPLTWEYLAHFNDVGGTIYPSNDPQGTLVAKLGASLSTISFAALFPIASIGVGYRVGPLEVEQYVHVPYLNSSFNNYVTDGTIYCEIFEKVGESYILVDSFQIGKVSYVHTWRLFTDGYNKTFYLGVRLKHTLYVEEEFRTDPSNYDTIYPYQYLTSAELLDTAWQARCDDVIYNLKLGSSNSVTTKTAEYDQLYKFQDDGPLVLQLAGSNSVLTKTAEYDQLFSFYDEATTTLKLGAGNSVITKTS
jgi:hypothetical protein